MKIDGNHSVLRSVYMEQNMQGGGVEQTKAADGSFAASFEKNRNDCFIEQLEQAGKSQSADEQTTEGSSNAMSKLEILANLVTERDLAQLKKQSEELEEEELDVIVTVVEKIKTQLAVYCDDFDSGMTEELSSEELSKLSHMTGNAIHVAKKLKENNLPVTEENVSDALSALELNEMTGDLTDDAKEYCIKADLELSIENLYMAMHSGNYEGVAGYYSDGSGYYAKAADKTAIAQLLPQIERMLVQSGIEPDEKTMGQAQWLVERQLPLTKENLLKLQQLDSLSSGEDGQEAALEHIVDALLDGKRPTQALMGEQGSVLERSEHIFDIIQNATDEQLKRVVASGQAVTVEHLEQAQTAHNEESEMFVQLTDSNLELVTARRQLEEIRLQMTVESAAVMIRHGISVETESMQQLIQHLKGLEEQYYQQLFLNSNVEATQANISLYKEIETAVAQIGQAPAAMLATVAFAEREMTVAAVSQEGAVWSERYKQANEAYETVMTKPRSDMGDSIQKAFRNVDDILEEMGLEVTAGNERAVRILGYNSMEITEENIQRVKSADMEMTTMLSHMKPKAVLEMIREGYNPLDKTPEQINEKLEQYQEDVLSSQESFSEFLWNLEHSNDISKEERDAYIGIYRLLHQIEKSDGAVVGALVNQGASMTMRNMMSSIRTGRHKGMDYKMGDVYETDDSQTNSITRQIEDGFRYLGMLSGKAKSQMQTMDWQQPADLRQIMDMSLEGFADYVQSVQNDGQNADAYTKEQLQLFHEACQSEEQVLERLTDMEIPVNLHNIFAAGQLYGNRGAWFRDLRNAAQGADSHLEEELLNEMANVEESFQDAQSAGEAYTAMLHKAQEVVDTAVEAEDITFEQMKGWKLLSSQIRLAGNLSAKEEYHIPVEIGGELTSVHVQFVHNESAQGRVAVSFETASMGKVAAEFTENSGKMDGYIVAENAEVKEMLMQMDTELKTQMEASVGIQAGKIAYVQHKQLDLLQFSGNAVKQGDGSKVTTAALYQVAKSVIGIMKNV